MKIFGDGFCGWIVDKFVAGGRDRWGRRAIRVKWASVTARSPSSGIRKRLRRGIAAAGSARAMVSLNCIPPPGIKHHPAVMDSMGTYPNPPLAGRPLKVGRSIPPPPGLR